MKRLSVKFTIILIITCLAAALLLDLTGCSGSRKGTVKSSEEITEVSKEETESKEDAGQQDTADSTIDSVDTEPAETDKKSGDSADSQNTIESAEEVPEEILDLIDEADDYYYNQEYGFAKNTYRKAEIAIDESELSSQKKQQLKESFYPKYEESKKIIETARTHFVNAKQLEYEQQYEEALKELEAAIAIYPNYKEALEEYESLKTELGLYQ